MNAPLVVGNWKMYGTRSECSSLAREISRSLGKTRCCVQVVLAPPYTAIQSVKQAIRKTNIAVAGQDSHWQDSGAFTGAVSPLMLRDSGCDFVILGHSERRHVFHENDQTVAQKTLAALRNDLRPIVCIGETLGERSRGLTARVIARQLRIALKGVDKTDIGKVEIAYEPVWAIGTGRNATPEQISQVHVRIRRLMAAKFGKARAGEVRILYGGSVKPENAPSLATTPEVNGLLVGGASLKTQTFLPIINCFTAK
jgi:triosephosphate isomerase (TIM)